MYPLDATTNTYSKMRLPWDKPLQGWLVNGPLSLPDAYDTPTSLPIVK